MSLEIRAERLSKWYGEVVGVQDLTLALPPGITALVGPNGSGKSTFLRLATGQIRPSQGSLRVGERDPWSDRAVLADVGYAPEGEGGPARVTPLDWVSDLALLSGLRPGESAPAARRALARARLTEEAWSRPLGTLSSGMRQKAKLAQAIVHDPGILVLDEPLSGIDPESRSDLIASIRAMAELGKTIVLSSHSLSDVARLTDRIALLYHGRLVAAGQVAAIRRLLDRYPFRIRIDTDDPRGLASLLVARREVLGVSIRSGKSLVLETDECDTLMNDLTSILASSPAAIRGFYQEDEDLGSVFEYLTRDASGRSPGDRGRRA